MLYFHIFPHISPIIHTFFSVDFLSLAIQIRLNCFGKPAITVVIACNYYNKCEAYLKT